MQLRVPPPLPLAAPSAFVQRSAGSHPQRPVAPQAATDSSRDVLHGDAQLAGGKVRSFLVRGETVVWTANVLRAAVTRPPPPSGLSLLPPSTLPPFSLQAHVTHPSEWTPLWSGTWTCGHEQRAAPARLAASCCGLVVDAHQRVWWHRSSPPATNTTGLAPYSPSGGVVRDVTRMRTQSMKVNCRLPAARSHCRGSC